MWWTIVSMNGWPKSLVSINTDSHTFKIVSQNTSKSLLENLEDMCNNGPFSFREWFFWFIYKTCNFSNFEIWAFTEIKRKKWGIKSDSYEYFIIRVEERSQQGTARRGRAEILRLVSTQPRLGTHRPTRAGRARPADNKKSDNHR